jgi:hypothetical protein
LNSVFTYKSPFIVFGFQLEELAYAALARVGKIYYFEEFSPPTPPLCPKFSFLSLNKNFGIHFLIFFCFE